MVTLWHQINVPPTAPPDWFHMMINCNQDHGLHHCALAPRRVFRRSGGTETAHQSGEQAILQKLPRISQFPDALAMSSMSSFSCCITLNVAAETTFSSRGTQMGIIPLLELLRD